MKYNVPLYMLLKESIERKIETGEYLPGEMLPSERAMAQELGMNRETVKKAINLLSKEGLVESIQGKGTFVVKKGQKIYHESYSPINNVGITAKLKLQGITQSSKMIAVETVRGNNRISKKLKINKQDYVYALHRTRYAEGVPFTVEYAYFPYDILDDDVHKYDFSEVSFYEYLNSKNHLPIEFRRKLIVVKCPKREANYLNIPIGTPVYLFEDIGRDKTGRIVEFVNTYTRTDQVKLTFNSYKDNGWY